MADRAKIDALAALARRHHAYCEDSWYSCPKDEDGCANDQWPKGVCNCGADEHNAKVDALLAELHAENNLPGAPGGR